MASAPGIQVKAVRMTAQCHGVMEEESECTHVSAWLADPWETKESKQETTCGPLEMQSAGHASGMACVWRQGGCLLRAVPGPHRRTVMIQRKQEGCCEPRPVGGSGY